MSRYLYRGNGRRVSTRTLFGMFLVCCALAAVAGYCAGNLSASEKDAKKTGETCLTCHVKYGSKELTKVGKYYKEHGKLP